VYFACAKLGLICVPINLGWLSEEIAYVLDHSGARGLVAETQLVEKMREAIVKVSAIADVIVPPGLGAGYEAEPADRTWNQAGRRGRSRDHR
jgi:acyl-CoA synthetase (AMP-forming)/AMP-acid ligase II